MCEHCNPHVTVVEAESVADYLTRYYKPDRIDAAGFEVLKRSYEIELEVYGFVVTSHYDSVTGGLIAWPKFEEWSPEMQAQVVREVELREKDPIINPQVRVQVQTAPAIDPFD